MSDSLTNLMLQEREEAEHRMAGLVFAIACSLCSLAGATITYIVLIK